MAPGGAALSLGNVSWNIDDRIVIETSGSTFNIPTFNTAEATCFNVDNYEINITGKNALYDLPSLKTLTLSGIGRQQDEYSSSAYTSLEKIEAPQTTSTLSIENSCTIKKVIGSSEEVKKATIIINAASGESVTFTEGITGHVDVLCGLANHHLECETIGDAGLKYTSVPD